MIARVEPRVGLSTPAARFRPGTCRALGALLTASALACGDGAEPSAPEFEVGIDGAYLVQSTQDYEGSVPLVQGRAGLLRVFLRARRAGLSAPGVRVRLHDSSGALLASYRTTAQPPPAILSTEVSQESLGDSWNFSIPADHVQPGRHLVVEMDEVAGIPRSRTRAELRYPASGDLDVRPVPSLGVTLVPVVQAPEGQPPLVPLVSGAEPAGGWRAPEDWLDRARRIHPLLDVEVDVAPSYTTGVALGADGSGWAELLAELELKRLAEGSQRHYLGAVRVSYPSGNAGIAYASPAGRPSSALAWDAGTTPESPSYQKVVAHELGHNLGLLHAPCGSPMPPGLDPGWPAAPAYADARIGVYGWDPRDGSVKSPASVFDLMSHCGTISSTWISDYGYRRVLGFLSGSAAAVGQGAQASAATGDAPGRRPCLVVSGRLRQGAVALEPAYVVETLPSLPAPGDFALELLDREGIRLASASFSPLAVAGVREGEPDERHFALALPLPPGRAEALGALVVRERGEEIHRSAPAEPVAPPGAARLTRSAGSARVAWDARALPGAMVRDPRSGRIVALLRGGAGAVVSDAPALEVLLSDGVRTRHRAVLSP